MGPRRSAALQPHSARSAGRPIDWAPSPTFHKLQTKVNFFFIRRGRGRPGDSPPASLPSSCFEGWGNSGGRDVGGTRGRGDWGWKDQDAGRMRTGVGIPEEWFLRETEIEKGRRPLKYGDPQWMGTSKEPRRDRNSKGTRDVNPGRKRKGV